MPPGTKLFTCNRCNLMRLRTVAICPDCGCPEYALRVADEQGWPVPDQEARVALEASPQKKAPKKKAPKKAEPVPPPDWEDPTGEIAAHQARREESTPVEPSPTEAPLHDYHVDLPDDGSGNPTFVGSVEAPNLAGARAEAARRFGSDFVPGTTLVVTPAKDILGGAFTEVGECATCGHRWPAKESVGCPACLHGPAEAERAPDYRPIPGEYTGDQPMNAGGEEEGPDRYFLVSARKGNPLYCLTGRSLRQAEGYVRSRHPADWDGSVKEVTPAEWVASPSWLTTLDVSVAPARPVFPRNPPIGMNNFPTIKSPARKPARDKTFRLILTHPEHDEPITLGEVKASEFNEARELLAAEYKRHIYRLDSGKMLKISPDDVKLVQVPAPRKRKEAAGA